MSMNCLGVEVTTLIGPGAICAAARRHAKKKRQLNWTWRLEFSKTAPHVVLQAAPHQGRFTSTRSTSTRSAFSVEQMLGM